MRSRIVGILVLRFLTLWLLLRGAVGLLSLLGGIDLWPSFGVSLRLALVLAAVAVVDVRRRGERILLANLGLGMPTVVAGAMATGIGAEIALALAIHAR